MKVKVMPTRFPSGPASRGSERRLQERLPGAAAAKKHAAKEFQSAIRVFIVAASPLARAGLETLLGGRAVKITGTASCLDEVTRETGAAADVILLDSAGTGGVLLDSTVASGLASRLSIVILADGVAADAVDQAYQAGVKAVLPGEILPDQLMAALLAAAHGLVVALPLAASPGRSRTPQTVRAPHKPLTHREREVLQWLARGQSNKEIAARLGVSERTVKFHVASILGKLGATTRTDAVALGIRRGLILL